jgi:hypothetical protein
VEGGGRRRRRRRREWGGEIGRVSFSLAAVRPKRGSEAQRQDGDWRLGTAAGEGKKNPDSAFSGKRKSDRFVADLEASRVSHGLGKMRENWENSIGGGADPGLNHRQLSSQRPGTARLR